MTPPFGTMRTLVHAVIQGLAGIVGPAPEGELYFYDATAQEKYPVTECPPITVIGTVAPGMVPTILDHMRTATVVHLR